MKINFTKKNTTRKPSKRLRSFNKKLAKYGLAGLNILLAVLVVGFLIYGRIGQDEQRSDLNRDDYGDEVAVLDEISSADIAANIAIATRLPETNQVINQADSRNALTSIAVSDDVVLTKPQIVIEANTNTLSRVDIQEYTAGPGDTVDTVAEKMGISADNLRWSNGLTGNSVVEGRTLFLPPRNLRGIVYKVMASDTIDGLASKYKSSAQKIVAFNDLELTNTLPVDEYIFIPDGEQPVAPIRSSSSFFNVSVIGFTPRFGGNGYSYGYCTYWAAGRRAEIGRPVPTNWGNANTWDDYARASGYLVDSTPEVGAVFQTDGYGHSIYHVGYVEEVYYNPDGSISGIKISEMNYAGWNVPSTRIISGGEVFKYNYIH